MFLLFFQIIFNFFFFFFILGAGVRACKGCLESFCSYCAAMPVIKNPCRHGSSHSLAAGFFSFFFSLPLLVSDFSLSFLYYYHYHSFVIIIFLSIEPTEGMLCGRCGNGGTHILSSLELKSFLERFPVQRYLEGGMIVETGAECEFVGYVLRGEINVEVKGKNGMAKRAGNIEAGEIFGEIGCLLGSESSATLKGGTGGTLVMKIPKEFVLEQQDPSFSSRFFRSLVQLIWKRIRGQERAQLESLKVRCQESRVTTEKQIWFFFLSFPFLSFFFFSFFLFLFLLLYCFFQSPFFF